MLRFEELPIWGYQAPASLKQLCTFRLLTASIAYLGLSSPSLIEARIQSVTPWNVGGSYLGLSSPSLIEASPCSPALSHGGSYLGLSSPSLIEAFVVSVPKRVVPGLSGAIKPQPH